MAKSPFSSAGGGSADTSPYSEARARGGRTCRADGGSVKAEARKGGNLGQIDGRKNGGRLEKLEKAEMSSNPKVRKAAMKAEKE